MPFHGMQLWIEDGDPFLFTTYTLEPQGQIVTRPIDELIRVPGLTYMKTVADVEAWLTHSSVRLATPLIGFSTDIARRLCGWTHFATE